LDIEPIALEVARDPRRPARDRCRRRSLRDSTMICSIPDMKGRHFLTLLLSGWTSVFCVPGSHTSELARRQYDLRMA
jgi:hypothetical protein